MNKIFGLLIVLALSFHAKAQTQYKDFVVSYKNIIGLTEKGELIIFDKENRRKTDNIDTPSKAVLLTKNRLGEIVVVDEKNRVNKYIKNKNTWEQIVNTKTNIFGVLFDSENTCYIITEDGIENTKSGKIYFSKNSLNHQIHYKNKWGKPYTYYIDNNNRIWIGFGYGEWGGNIFIFDTKKGEFLTPNYGEFEIELWPIKSFFETNDNVFVSSGLQHMMTSGILVKFDNLNATEFYESKSDWSEPQGKDTIQNMIEGEYIGPATFNKFNNSIYYYSQEGIKKGQLDNDLSKKGNWELVIKPKLHWKYGQPDAVGSPMNVLKLEILDENKLIFLSQNDGIGLFNGKELIMLK
ncbi:MAG: hypothetical protein JXB49_06640 [Bacteroidales bacterium]|nr:hypothetical protein [Bacteroidales bacterium]